VFAVAGCEGADFVTCGSVIKLKNRVYDARLHSQQVTYGSGSRQQTVTAIGEETSASSYWWVRGTSSNAECSRGKAIGCGEDIRLQHVNTNMHLHSHNIRAPLSSNQEVSAFDQVDDPNDVWTVLCQTSEWRRDDFVQLNHRETQTMLAISGKSFNRPIRGQLEVVTMKTPGNSGLWKAVEGVFVGMKENLAEHDEL